MAKIFDREEEPNEFMEMPCRCGCGKWFDLNDGYTSRRQKNTVICGECGELEEQEIEREEKIDELKERYEDARLELKEVSRELKQMGVDVPKYYP